MNNRMRTQLRFMCKHGTIYRFKVSEFTTSNEVPSPRKKYINMILNAWIKWNGKIPKHYNYNSKWRYKDK